MLAALIAISLISAFVIFSGAALSRRYLRAAERERRAWESERHELLDRIMYLADRPWSPPPHEPEETVYAPEWDDTVWPELETES